MVSPDIGVAIFVLATFVSLVIGHVHLYLHRTARALHQINACTSGRGELDGSSLDGASMDEAAPAVRVVWSSRPRPMCSTHFVRLLCWRRTFLPRALRVLVPSLLVLCSACMALGYQVTSFKVSVEGLVGSLVGDARVSEWSIASLTREIPNVTHLTSATLMRTLQESSSLLASVYARLRAGACADWLLPHVLCDTNRGRLAQLHLVDCATHSRVAEMAAHVMRDLAFVVYA